MDIINKQKKKYKKLFIKKQSKDILHKQKIKNNDCGFFSYCMNALEKTPYNCTCMDPNYYFNNLKKQEGGCKVLELRREAQKKYRKEETIKIVNKPEQLEKSFQADKEKHRVTHAAEIYLGIFNEFEQDPLTDKQIIDRVYALTGSKPTSRNISSYRCNYNQGKIKGQIKIPNKKVERKCK